MAQYYAHTGSSMDELTWQPLTDHLNNVAARAAQFAEPFGGAEWARLAGILHDVGKGCREFQLRLRGKHPAIDHSIAGAHFADTSLTYNAAGLVHEGSLVSTLVAGHHVGMQDFSGEHPLSTRLEQYGRKEIPQSDPLDVGIALPDADVIPAELLKTICARESLNDVRQEFMSFAVFVFARLLFSTLVDADWLDTERFMSPDDYARRVSALDSHESLQVLSARLDEYLASMPKEGLVNEARNAILHQAQDAATKSTGIFELRLPTGSGKTLTSLSFALRHALAQGKSRVIYAMPYTSIVEQNSQVFRDVLGPNNIVEHVSGYDYGLSDVDSVETPSRREQGLREKMIAQNWDAPLVVTTNVQLFESLFSNKAARSRKVHNIANSVIVLDEAQALPDRLLVPTLAMLEELSAVAHVTTVLCTATQPSLSELWPFHTCITPIIEDRGDLDQAFGKRVIFDVVHIDPSERYVLDELVDELIDAEQALCVVSSRRGARMLYDTLAAKTYDCEGLYHLSAFMVPAHRSSVIDDIRTRLRKGLPCRVVSTQLVEAGVDLDFPVVYREIAGIDSIVQAAGRCNREGKLARPGRVVVFDCVEFDECRPSRPNWLGKMRSLAIESIGTSVSRGIDPFGEEALEAFFDRRHQTGCLDGTDEGPIYRQITNKSQLREHVVEGHYAYETIAKRYQFFTDDTVGIFIPWGKDGESLLAAIEVGMFSYDDYPRLQRFTVSIPRFLLQGYENVGAIRHIEGFPVPTLETRDGLSLLYDDERGLLSPGEEELDVLVV